MSMSAYEVWYQPPKKSEGKMIANKACREATTTGLAIRASFGKHYPLKRLSIYVSLEYSAN